MNRVTGRDPVFPIGISERGRHFCDAAGRPFFWHGDTCWKLFWEYDRAEAQAYLAQRRERGFNVILAHLLPHRTHKCNRRGEAAFLEKGRIDLPNEAYFSHVEEIIDFGRELGLAFALAPIWLSTWEQDWHRYFYKEAVSAYSLYVANRFKHKENILAWIHGGDDDALDKHEEIRESAAIYKIACPRVLSTYHAGIGGGWNFFGKEPWYDFSLAYTYHYSALWDQFREAAEMFPGKPVILGETHYEGNEGISGQEIRRFAYTSVLLGNAGHTYGHKDIWMYTMFWSSALCSVGSHHMELLRELMEKFDFSSLAGLMRGEAFKTLRSKMPGAGETPFPAAISEDGKVLLAYLEDTRWFCPVKEWKEGHYIDPVSGRYFPFRPLFAGVYQIPGKNAAGDSDWLLCLKKE